MNLKAIIIIVITSVIVSLTSVFVYHSSMKQKIGYIEIKKVFDGFQMKKELEDKFKQNTKVKERILDSLSFNLKLMSKQLNEQQGSTKGVDKDLVYAFEYKREEFLKLKNQYNDESSVLSRKYDAQILERLTQYVIEYGKNNGYKMIFGADGNGSLMYATDDYNVSSPVIEFINKKYSGKD